MNYIMLTSNRDTIPAAKCNRRFALLSNVAMRPAFANGGWKLDADGKIEMKDGNPVFIDANGGELTLGTDTVSRLNGEAKALRTRAETAEGSLKAFEGLDATKARAAIDTVSKLDQKQLVDAGEIDKVREEVGKGYTQQIADRDATINTLRSSNDGLTKDKAFGSSKFLAERLAVPADMATAMFGGQFKIEDGKIIPHDANGNKLYSKTRMGEIADVDEAFEMIVETYPHKDKILKAPDAGGSGNNGNGGNRGGSNVMKRSQFDALSPADKATAGQSMGKGELTIVD